ncbi:ribonuclease H-like domain-containing protein [Tanacetum coccineum]
MLLLKESSFNDSTDASITFESSLSSPTILMASSSSDTKDSNWSNAMYDEYNVLVKNGTWILVLKPTDANMVRSMWLFKHKFHADGTLNRYKARLVATGSSQQLGVDFDETFSPVVKLATIRTGTLDLGLHLYASATTSLVGYTDAVLGSVEAEYQGVANVVAETAWLRNLLLQPAQLNTGYYVDVLNNKGLFTSDQSLLTSKSTSNQVHQNTKDPYLWKSKFTKAMVKMGKNGVLTGSQGEIRKNCRVINK